MLLVRHLLLGPPPRLQRRLNFAISPHRPLTPPLTSPLSTSLASFSSPDGRCICSRLVLRVLVPPGSLVIVYLSACGLVTTLPVLVCLTPSVPHPPTRLLSGSSRHAPPLRREAVACVCLHASLTYPFKAKSSIWCPCRALFICIFVDIGLTSVPSPGHLTTPFPASLAVQHGVPGRHRI